MTGQIDPRELTAAELAALRAIGRFNLFRKRGGFGVSGGPAVTLKMVGRLAHRRLVERAPGSVRVTGIGRNTLAVDEQRRGR